MPLGGPSAGAMSEGEEKVEIVKPRTSTVLQPPVSGTMEVSGGGGGVVPSGPIPQTSRTGSPPYFPPLESPAPIWPGKKGRGGGGGGGDSSDGGDDSDDLRGGAGPPGNPRGGPQGPAAPASGVGVMRLEAPPRYGGGQKPGVRAWLREVHRWMRLMRYAERDYIDIVATRTVDAAASWLTHEQLAIERGVRAPWRNWEEFREEMTRAFEPTTDETLARQQLAVLKQTGRVAGYIQRFREIRGRIQDMSVQDEFAAFIRGLQPRIKAQVGALVEEDLAAAMRLAARVELWSGETSGQGDPKMGKKGQKGQSGSSGGQPARKGAVHVVESTVSAMEKGKPGKKGKKRQSGKGSKGSGGQGSKGPSCYLCGGPHVVRNCPDWKFARDAVKAKKQGNA